MVSSSDSAIEVLARGLSGEVLYGPQFLSRATAVAELRATLEDQMHWLPGLTRVVLMWDGALLQDWSSLHVGLNTDGSPVEPESLHCTAIFQHDVLSEDERRACIAELTVSRRYRYVHRPVFETMNIFSSFSDVAKADVQVVSQAVRVNWRLLECVHEKFRGDRAVVSIATQQSGEALKFASLALRSDREFVLQAVRRHGKALEFVSIELFEDPDFLLEAVFANNSAIGHVPVDVDPALLMSWVSDASDVPEVVDRAEALRRVRVNGMWLANAVEFQSDPEVVKVAITQNYNAFRFTTLTDDRDVVLTAVRANGKMLEFASVGLRRDREVVLMAIRSNPRAKRFAIDKPLFHVSDTDATSESEAAGDVKPFSKKRITRKKQLAACKDGLERGKRSKRQQRKSLCYGCSSYCSRNCAC